jgi:hypothetical protein
MSRKIMNAFLAAVALAAIASPAFAQSSSHVSTNAHAQAVQQRSGNYAYVNRPKVGTDPSAFIRDMLRQDPPGNYN